MVAALHGALREMEGELKAGKPTKVCRAEICRRANVGESTLKNPSHADTRAFVKAELARLKRLGDRAPARKTLGAGNQGTRVDRTKILIIQLDGAMREIACLKAELTKSKLEDARRLETARSKDEGSASCLAAAA